MTTFALDLEPAEWSALYAAVLNEIVHSKTDNYRDVLERVRRKMAAETAR